MFYGLFMYSEYFLLVVELLNLYTAHAINTRVTICYMKHDVACESYESGIET